MVDIFDTERVLSRQTLTGGANNVIRFVAGGATRTVTLSAGDYYQYRGSQVSTYQPLLAHIETQINALGFGTYEFRAATPLRASKRPYWGLRLVRTSGTGAWGWALSDGAWTFDRRLLGYLSTDVLDVTGDVTDIVGPNTPFGIWQPPRRAIHPKLWEQRRLIEPSDDPWRDEEDLDWGTREERHLRWHRIPRALFDPALANVQAYADTALLGLGDTHHGWQDVHLSFAARATVLVFYDALQTLDATAHWDALRMLRLEDRQRMDGYTTRHNFGGDHWQIRLAAARVAGTAP